MGRNKKKTAVVTTEDSDSEQSDVETTTAPVAPAPAPATVEAPVAVAASAAPTSEDPTTLLWVEIVKSEKKKPTTFVRGLAQHGLKLPATAAQLKKLVGATDVVKEEADCLEVQGDVATQLKDALITKLKIPAELITDNKVKAIAALVASRSAAAVSGSSSAAPSDAKKQQGGGADDDSDDEEDEEDIVITRGKALRVEYCPVCTFPAEMCEYSGVLEKCKPWLMEQVAADEAARIAEASEKGRKRKILTESEKVDKLLAQTGKRKVDHIVLLESKTRSGKKRITTVTGLDLFGVNLIDASRDFKKAYSCGAGIVEEVGKLPAIEIQGDVVQSLCEQIPVKYPQVPASAIFYMDGKTRVAAHS